LIKNMVRPEERTEKAGVGGSTPSLATIFNHHSNQSLPM